MKKRRLKKGVYVFLIFLLIIGGVCFYFYYNKDEKPNIFKKYVYEEEWPKVYKASLLATGDGLLHNAVYQDAYNKSTGTYDFSPQLELVKDIIPKYDIAYYNQETVFANGNYSSYPRFWSPKEFGDAMVNVGFNVVSLASNHSADCGTSCLGITYEYWKTKGVVFDGLNDSSGINQYNISEANGITYGFLEYTNTLNGLNGLVNGYTDYTIDLYDEEKVDREVAELKEKVDVVIVAMHWHKNSSEYGTTPTAANKEIAQHLADIGVDIILGTYSHCLQPFDILNDHTIVFYSLGNFISNQLDLNDMGFHPYIGVIGVLATMDITKTVYEDGTYEINVGNIGADLIYSYHKNHKNYRVVPFSKMTLEYNKNYYDLYREYTGYLTALNNNITLVSPAHDPNYVDKENPVLTLFNDTYSVKDIDSINYKEAVSCSDDQIDCTISHKIYYDKENDKYYIAYTGTDVAGKSVSKIQEIFFEATPSKKEVEDFSSYNK